MTETHFLNEELKRLEPTETCCAYCESGVSTNMEENYFCPLFKENDRTNIVIYRSVQFNKINVGIPRCSKCYFIHTSSLKFGKIVATSIAVLLAVLIFVMFGFAVIIYMAIGIPLILFFVPRLIADLKTEKQSIIIEKRGARKVDLIQDMLRGGWSLKQPKA